MKVADNNSRLLVGILRDPADRDQAQRGGEQGAGPRGDIAQLGDDAEAEGDDGGGGRVKAQRSGRDLQAVGLFTPFLLS